MINELYAALDAVHTGQELSPLQVDLPDGLTPDVRPLAQQVHACLTAGDSKALLDLCFSPVWQEYKTFLTPLPMTLCLTEAMIDLLNILDPQEDPLVFLAERCDLNGNPVFQEDETRSLAFDRMGCQLMTTTRSGSGSVSGWKKEFRYEGETENGLPHGQGTQHTGTRRLLTGRISETPFRSGRWEKGVLAEGTFQDALVVWNGGDLAEAFPMEGPDGAPLQLATCVPDVLIEKSTPSCSGLYVADLTVGPNGYAAQEPLVPLCPGKGGEFRMACQDCFLCPPVASVTAEMDDPDIPVVFAADPEL